MKKWTDLELSLLRQRIHEGFTSKEVAAELNRTRGQVSGMALRIGLDFSRSVGRRRQPAPEVPQPVEDIPAPKPSSPNQLLYGLLELRDHMCKWPVGGRGEDTMFCGKARFEELSYCPRHCRMAYSPTSRMVERLNAVRA